MNQIGLVFILEGPAWQKAVVTVKEAEEIINGFNHGEIESVIGGSSPHGIWAVRTDKIMGIHTAPLEEKPGLTP